MTNEAITFIRPTALTDQAPYAYAATTSAEQAIYTAGACPLDAAGRQSLSVTTSARRSKSWTT